MTAQALGFDRPTANSLDSVADRDFSLETLAAASICAIHLSRLAEEIVIWTTPQFGFVKLSDKFTTGSSIMPQKRNPDAAELVRGKSGRVIGALNALLIVMKGLPMTYEQGHAGGQGRPVRRHGHPVALHRRDDGHGQGHGAAAQGDEEGGGRGLRHRDRPCRLAGADPEDAVPRGAPRHGPHRRRLAAGRNVGLEKLELAEMQGIEPRITHAIFEVLGVERSVRSRTSYGGTAPSEVRRQAKRWLARLKRELADFEPGRAARFRPARLSL